MMVFWFFLILIILLFGLPTIAVMTIAFFEMILRLFGKSFEDAPKTTKKDEDKK